jgi:hypothetical protein
MLKLLKLLICLISPAAEARLEIWFSFALSSKLGCGRLELLCICELLVLLLVRVNSVRRRSSMEDIVRTTRVMGAGMSSDSFRKEDCRVE